MYFALRPDRFAPANGLCAARQRLLFPSSPVMPIKAQSAPSVKPAAYSTRPRISRAASPAGRGIFPADDPGELSTRPSSSSGRTSV